MQNLASLIAARSAEISRTTPADRGKNTGVVCSHHHGRVTSVFTRERHVVEMGGVCTGHPGAHHAVDLHEKSEMTPDTNLLSWQREAAGRA